MARNSRFNTTSGPSANRDNKRGKSSKKDDARPRNKKRDDSSGDRKAPFKSFERKTKGGFKGSKDIKRGGKPARPDQARPFSKPEKPAEKRAPRRDSPSFSRIRPDSRTEGRTETNRQEDTYRGRGTEKKSFIESRLDKQRQRRSAPAEAKTSSKDDLIRLNKFISNSGVCSRREADELIAMGLITVNGKVVTELGYKVKITDDVRHDGKRLKAEKPVYILLNKPKGFITTTDDPQERHTVMHLIEGACNERVYPVGRLDRNTSGLLLLTNDGELTEKLSHPSHNVKKIYKAELDRPLTKNDFQKIRDGVRLEEGKAVVDDLAIISEDGKTIGLELHIGWNRIVRRIFEALGYQVEKLDRSVYATLDKKDLPRGHWRFLRQDEIIRLKHFQ